MSSMPPRWATGPRTTRSPSGRGRARAPRSSARRRSAASPSRTRSATRASPSRPLRPAWAASRSRSAPPRWWARSANTRGRIPRARCERSASSCAPRRTRRRSAATPLRDDLLLRERARHLVGADPELGREDHRRVEQVGQLAHRALVRFGDGGEPELERLLANLLRDGAAALAEKLRRIALLWKLSLARREQGREL